MTTPQPSASTAPPAPHTTFTFKAAMFLVPFVISMVMIGVFTKNRVSEIRKIDQQLEKEKERRKDPAGVAPQYAKYQQLLGALETRVNTIQALQNSRTGPVEFMRAVGKLATQTADVDLNSFAPEGERCVFRGRSHSVESTARFLTSLQSSRSFSHVKLRKFYQENGKNSTTYHFEFESVFLPASTVGSTP